MGYYPSARYLLVEAQQAIHGPMLRRFQAEHGNVICEICAAGNKPGEINFEAGDPMGGQASATHTPEIMLSFRWKRWMGWFVSTVWPVLFY